MNVLGLIPARGGSKGIPGKNIIPLRGKPLLAWTGEAARASRSLTRVVLSTDDPEIARVGRECGVEVPFLRPPELARDDTPSLDVAVHALQWLATHESWSADVLVLLQPTSPLRRAEHIDGALAELERSGADTVVSVVEVPHHFSPYKVLRLESGRLVDFWTEPTDFDRHRRQNLPRLYARNGPAVLATRVAVLTSRRSFYGPHVAPYLMDEESSFDIDRPADLALVAAFLRGRSPSASENMP
jgi:CMP-N-acetylneuraminic acid synthetase